ncbi:hypothetical protein [Bradyrhizobium japonicum]|uniref:hypothetical protein n=1 Tax=Bradyrhizobium japonicum TaxID=375 RepID=UPI00200E145C|nr:hypothetical protein [Bradyrhizobium japonicum]UQD96146.1 hypothetical protein JEY30_31900 [Bradyrhizobium japonicum]
MPPRAKKTVKTTEGGKRYPLNVRTTFELRQSIEAAAAQSGRSLTQEAEARIESSFQQENAASVLEDQLKKWFQLADKQKEQIKELTEQLTESRLAFNSANMLKENAEERTARSEENLEACKKHLDHAVLRSIEIEKSRDRLVQRVDELVELLAQSRGVRIRGAS